MKELSIEEKAKRYDELKVTAQGLEHDGCFDKITLFDLFPELKESEERTRKSLLEYLKTLPNHYAHSGVCAPEWIAWLEKQGEQKKSTKEKLMTLSDGKQHLGWLDDADKVIESEQKPANTEKGAKGNEREIPNSAWSEEDEGNMGGIVANLEYLKDKANTITLKERFQEKSDWLESLKDRVQPKQDWSEEDKKMLNHIINDIESLKEQVYCKTLCDEEITWLKSLRPQSHWKPSEEQKNALYHIVRDFGKDKSEDEMLLESLLSDLDRL